MPSPCILLHGKGRITALMSLSRVLLVIRGTTICSLLATSRNQSGRLCVVTLGGDVWCLLRGCVENGIADNTVCCEAVVPENATRRVGTLAACVPLPRIGTLAACVPLPRIGTLAACVPLPRVGTSAACVPLCGSYTCYKERWFFLLLLMSQCRERRVSRGHEHFCLEHPCMISIGLDVGES
jgi:hypothetical protein